jgi:hypothetical protein
MIPNDLAYEIEKKTADLPWEEQNRVRVEIGYQILSRQLNGASFSNVTEALFNTLVTDHRFLQNEFWRMIHRLAYLYSNTGFDERNRWAVEFAERIVDTEEQGR